ncbi:UPF0041-domain-containing protein [Piedraia hortae CBS 480.64]|uniref:Mitochondrial pyruvate carrier n=1 Tax=Piedraia hortae CBS 480.64 TaxID=1314780 RepID=A0A6A7C0T0_9PEZI|nr:UPF0041-domain-containing protein [Piedraia hortae CBS 480.64]
MAAAIKALNARIRANPVLDYFCSTHFWGPASNFGIPLAAVMDTQKDPEIISGQMTTALIGYSAVFMRYAMAVTPRNYLLFGCHAINFTAQCTQMYRYTDYWYRGGKERAGLTGGSMDRDAAEAENKAAITAHKLEGVAAQASHRAEDALTHAKARVEGAVDKAKSTIEKGSR